MKIEKMGRNQLYVLYKNSLDFVVENEGSHRRVFDFGKVQWIIALNIAATVILLAAALIWNFTNIFFSTVLKEATVEKIDPDLFIVLIACIMLISVVIYFGYYIWTNIWYRHCQKVMAAISEVYPGMHQFAYDHLGDADEIFVPDYDTWPLPEYEEIESIEVVEDEEGLFLPLQDETPPEESDNTDSAETEESMIDKINNTTSFEELLKLLTG